MVSPGRHPKKEVAEALTRARAAGLIVREVHRGHRWGEVVCASCPARQAVFSTPRDPANHAKIIGRFIYHHLHR